ncbi:hypothetical protein MTR67_003259 [Solanum verrucosum]|uniref:Uncharacterized protein n=1 Tax=Solanum verrucosum TaxID=315347 RepID=A0AAF0PXQ5_SOLVR|nr:hypothetical protein MTR67_003259 [Solanum verrucosum]
MEKLFTLCVYMWTTHLNHRGILMA